MTCFRKSPCFSSIKKQKLFIRKILGIIAYNKEFLLKITQKDESPIETAEFIEQIRIIEYGYDLTSVPVPPSLPSVNEPNEVEIIYDYLDRSTIQKKLLKKILEN